MDLERMLAAACFDGIIECEECGNSMEPDAKRCGECGEPNPLIELGMI